ncbi:hypothetical protein [Arthrobacter sp. ERGS1:01]|uniref:hypothetical protein n=1 Tax=Arthrobacter sp. ERGS1:01 TaxID=1704044 RepID=UPI000A3EF3F5|nr:hypothetical protein [Arthrobacter sp. ERGS1:01]
MDESDSEPVEISTRMGPGEWTPETLTELVGSYQHKLWEMGAAEDEIETSVETSADGSAKVNLSWWRTEVQAFAATGQTMMEESDNSRGHGEIIRPGETTRDSKGLGAVFGDAERSPIDGPPTGCAVKSKDDQKAPDYVLYTGEDGKSYVKDAGQAKE